MALRGACGLTESILMVDVYDSRVLEEGLKQASSSIMAALPPARTGRCAVPRPACSEIFSQQKKQPSYSSEFPCSYLGGCAYTE